MVLGSLALKLILTPLLVGVASLAGRRWGSAVGGWLVGIPFTSGPIVFFLTLEHGPRFAAAAATGIMAGTASQAAFGLAYAWMARSRGWIACLAMATMAFGVATVVLNAVRPAAWVLLIAVVVVLVLSLFLMPRGKRSAEVRIAFPAWDLPARMIVATIFVVLLTGVAPILGARLAGLLAPFPLYATVLAVFAHRIQGAAPAIGVLRGLLLGLFSFAAFFFILSEMLVAQGIVVAFAASIAVAVAMQGASLLAGRRLALA